MLATTSFKRWPYKRNLSALVVMGMAVLANGAARIGTALIGALTIGTVMVGAVIIDPVPCASAASPAPWGEHPSAAAEHDQDAWIAAYKRLAGEHQLRWLENLLRDRTERAAALVQTDEDFVALHRYNTEVLNRVRAGKSLSPRGLETLLASADAMEQQAIEHLALRYRLAVYAAFRTERREYDLRIEAWRRVEFAWRLAGRHPHEQSRLIDWLAESVDRVEHGRVDLLPARPKFGNTVTEMVAAARPAATTAPSPAPAARLPRAASQTLPKVSPAAVAAASESVVAGESIVVPAGPHSAVGARRLPRGPVEANGPPALPAAVALKQDTRSRRGDPSAAVRAANQPPVLPVDTTERAAGKIDPAPAPARPRAAVGVDPKGTGPSAVQAGAPDIDLLELRDRLSGYKLAVAGVNGRLHEPGLVGASRLTPIVNELEELITRRGDLMLYLQLVADQGGKRERLESPSAALSLVSAKISVTRLLVEEQSAEVLLPKQQAELASLDQLSRRLAVLAVQLQEQHPAK